jgi:hypothetical protein
VASEKTANQLQNERAALQAAQEANARVRELKAWPWWTCTACGEQFRWDREHRCAWSAPEQVTA